MQKLRNFRENLVFYDIVFSVYLDVCWVMKIIPRRRSRIFSDLKKFKFSRL